MDLFEDVPLTIKKEIKQDIMIAAGVSPVGAFVPWLDTGAIASLWAKMLYRIGKINNVEMSQAECAKIITACGSGIFAYLGGTKLLNWMLNLIPGVGMLGAMAGNVIFNGYYTYALGMAFHKMFRTEGINDRTIYEIAKIG